MHSEKRFDSLFVQPARIDAQLILIYSQTLRTFSNEGVLGTVLYNSHPFLSARWHERQFYCVRGAHAERRTLCLQRGHKVPAPLLMAVFVIAGEMEGVVLCAVITDGCVRRIEGVLLCAVIPLDSFGA